MRKILVGFSMLIFLTSCQYVDSTIDTLKDNVKNSIYMPNVLPSVNMKSNTGEKQVKDSVSHFTLSSFFATKFDL